MSKPPTVADLAEQVHQLRQELAAARVEIAAHAGVAARVVEISGLDVIRKALGERTASEQLRQANIEQERQRAKKRAEKAQAEQVARDERLAAAAKLVNGAGWLRISAPKGWSSSCPIPMGSRSYWSIESWGSREMTAAELRQMMASDQQNEIREGLASGQLQFDPLPDTWPSMDSGQQRRNENEWRGRRGGK